MVDVCRRLSPMQAIELADRIAEFNPYWYEEPCPVDNVDALAEIRSKTKIPIVTGETLYGRGSSCRFSKSVQPISSIRMSASSAASWR